MTADRLPLEFCPLCSRADATTTHASAVASDQDMSISIILPERLCGRCAVAIARAGLEGAQQKHAQMRGLRA